jgi:2-polyprenyl-6-methoxyphenol hydroxylase-like FAD-dependent oxidoreductase
MTNNGRTTCLVVGGGPAGMVLGLLLARAGVAVTVLEKHGDFLRDFRGDTVHASTLALLDELGLGERFAAVPHRLLRSARVQLDAGDVQVGDLGRLPGPHRHIALVPQWDFLDLLADAAAEEPSFALRRDAEVVGLLREGGRVAGVRWRDRTTGAEHELRAQVTVGCDGRHSAVRAAAGLRRRGFGVPMDVEWFRLPRREGDPAGLVARISAGQMCVLIDRGDYWQAGYVIGKGSDGALRAAGVEELRTRLAALLPWLADRVDAVTGWDRVSLLEVRLDRVRRWSTDGLLLIGDAAHAMSPLGGVGINLAVQDAVAAARVLAPALASGGVVPRSVLHRVQRRRWWPTSLVQGAQRIGHRAVLGRALDRRPRPAGTAARLPRLLRLAQRFPALQGLPARMIAIGPLPEHAPAWARRPAAPVPAPSPEVRNSTSADTDSRTTARVGL